MFKKLGAVIGILLLTLAFVQPASAANYEIGGANVVGGNTINVGTIEGFSTPIVNNTGSAASLRVDVYLSSSLSGGLLLYDHNVATSPAPASGPTCTDIGEVFFTCTMTVQAATTINLVSNIIGRDCVQNGTIVVKLYSGGVLQETENVAYTKSGTSYACSSDITPTSGWDVFTSMAHNTTGFYEEIEFTAPYPSNTTGILVYGLTYSLNSTHAQYDGGAPSTGIYRDPGGTLVEWCDQFGNATYANCDETQFASGKTQIIAAWYHTGSFTGTDYKFLNFFKGGVLQYQRLITVSFT